MSVQLELLDDRLAVIVDEPVAVSAGGIVIPDMAQDRQSKGVVYQVGPGKRLTSGDRAAMSLKVNDRVVFNRFAGQDIYVDEKPYKILNENDILAIVTG